MLGVVAAPAQAPALDTLVKNSPFGNAPSPNAAAGNADTALEFRGVFVDAGEPFFSLYDVAGRRALWVGLKEPGNPFVVQAYDEAKGAVVVEYQGRTLTISLKQAKVVTLPPAAIATVTPGTPGAPGTAAPSATVVGAAGTPPDEAVRLAQIAEEIRRRRAIRAQAMQQNAAGPQPAAPPPAPPGNRP